MSHARTLFFDVIRATRDTLDRVLEDEAVRRAPEVIAKRFGVTRAKIDELLRILGDRQFGAVESALALAAMKNGDAVHIARQMREARDKPGTVVHLDCGNAACEACSKRREETAKARN